MQEDGGLRHLGLLQVLLRTFKHKVRDTESENIIGFFKKFLCFGVVVIQVFAHSDKLGALARKNVSFHFDSVVISYLHPAGCEICLFF